MSEILLVVARWSMTIFVLASMAALGLTLHLTEILRPLRNWRIVVGALVPSFILVPAAMRLVLWLLPEQTATFSALMVMSACAGAPVLPTLVGLARGNRAVSATCTVLLMGATAVVAPILVPRLVPGAAVSAAAVAASLVSATLMPLAVGMLVKKFAAGTAEKLVMPLQRLSQLGLGVGMVAVIIVGWRGLVSSVGSWIFIGTAILIALALGLGAGTAKLLGGDDPMIDTMSLAAAQRNIPAVLVVALGLGTDVTTRTVAAIIVSTVLLAVVAGRLGRRSLARTAEAVVADAP